MRYRVRPRNPSGIYWIDVHDPTLPGGRYRASLGTRDPAEAEHIAKQVIATRSPAGAPKGYQSLRGALEAVVASKANASTRDSYSAKAKRLIEHFGEDANILALDDFDIQTYAEARRFRVGQHTLHKEMTLLRQAWCRYSPGRVSPVPKISSGYKPRKRFLTVDEAAKLLRAAAGSKFRSWLWVALYTGAEPAALERMRWEHFDMDLGMVHVMGTKTETRDRMVPLHDELAAFLGTLDREAPLLPYWNASRRTRPIRLWCHRAGIDRCTLVDLRRTFGSWLKQAGADSKRVADLMGHRTTAMVDRVYGQLNTASYRDAVALLPRLGVA